MTEQSSTPLIGPLKQRSWREIMRFRPIGTTLHAALVVTRQGRLVGVIPAGDRRVLSDYLTWPYDFREVDMRERLLPIALRLESADPGYEFGATLKIVYQVERPERVAFELEDALTELEQVLEQSIRATSRSFGVEQPKALEQHLLEALLYGDVLRGRLVALGLQLCRADVTLELDERARDRADLLREHMRERPLSARMAIESLDAGTSFEALIGGSYRLTSRTHVVAEEREAKLRDVVHRTLNRVGITFAAHDYESAERAMVDALRFDSLFQSELATAEIELMRGTVKIQPNREMVLAAQQAIPALPAPALERPEYSEQLPVGNHFEPSEQLDNVMPWGTLGKMFGRAPETGAADQYTTSEMPSRSFDTTPGYESSGISAGQTDEVHLSGDYRSGIDNRDALQVPTPADPSAPPSWAVLRGSNEPDVSMSQLGASAMSEEPASAAPPEALPDSVAQPSFLADPPLRPHPASAVDPERITRWITLLKADDPALFKLWSLELQGQPDALPTILSALTDDPVLLQFADDAECQQALVLAIGLVADSPANEQQFVAPSAPSAPAAEAAPAPEPLPEEPPPDWLRLRRAWKDDGGEA